MVTKATRVAVSCLSLAIAWGCKPDEEGRPSLLEEPRILAIQALPAEAAPGKATVLELFRAGPAGRLDSSDVALDFCVVRKPIAAPGIVAEQCLAMEPNDSLVPIVRSMPTSATIPEQACSLFGPKPATTGNDEALRTADPDTTGGYYQPIRAVNGGTISLFATRISCGLTGTTQEASIEYTRRYRPNENPAIQQVLLGRSNGEVETLEQEVPASLRTGERVAFAVKWNDCPSDKNECGDSLCNLDETAASCPEDCSQAPSCAGAETYLLLDPVSRLLRLQRENIRVSWFVTGGELERDKSGRSSNELERDAQNQFTAPAKAGDYWLFAVIRDDRGGVGWVEQPLRVE
jgi:hypothetical protein